MMGKTEFSRLHPVCQGLFALCVILFSFWGQNPFLSLILLLGALFWQAERNGPAALLHSLGLLLLFSLAMALINPLFSHRGETILLFLNSKPITLEALMSGAQGGLSLSQLLLWCTLFSKEISQESFLFLLGKPFPRLALLLSMAMRFFPRFQRRLVELYRLQSAGEDRGYLQKIRLAANVFAVGTSLTIEESFEIAAGITARGYGRGKRSCYSIFSLSKRDWICIFLFALALLFFLLLTFFGAFRFSFYPTFSYEKGSYLFSYLTLLPLSLFPGILERKEKIRWRILKSKI